MEFTALPSQGAGIGKITSESRKDTDRGFDDVMEKALAETGLILGLPIFIHRDSQKFTEPVLDDPVLESTRPKEDSRGEVAKEKTESDTHENVDWKALREEEGPTAAGREGSEQSKSTVSSDNGHARGMGIAVPVTEGGGTLSPGIQGAMEGISGLDPGPRSSGMSVPRGVVPPSGSSLPQRILRIVTLMNQQGMKTHRAMLRMRSEKLGAVEIDIKLEDGRLSVRIAAMDDAAREALEAEMDRIRAILEGQGFEELSLQLEMGRGETGGEDAMETPPGGLDFELEADRNENGRPPSWDGLIDLLA